MRVSLRQKYGYWFLLAGFFACADTGGGGCTDCSGMAPVPYPQNPPAGGELQPDVVRARLTQSTLDFLAKNLEPLLAQFLVVQGREARFVFPDDILPPDSPVTLSPGSYIAFDLDNLQAGMSMTWLDPDAFGRPGMRLTIRDADLFLDITFGTLVEFFPDAVCRIQSDTGLAAITVTELSFDLRIEVDESGALPALSAITENVQIDLSDASDDVVLAMSVTPCDGSSTNPDTFCDDPICAGVDANCPDVCGLVDLFTQLGGFLIQIITPVLEEFAPSIAGFLSNALVEVLGAIPLGIETQLDLLGLLGPSFANAQPLNLRVAASGGVTVAGPALGRGLDLGLNGGVTSATVTPCAIGATPPDLAALRGPAPDFSGWVEVEDLDGEGTTLERYHFAATISQALLNQATWAMFQSGLLCFNLDSEDIEGLVGDAFVFRAELLQTFDTRLAGLTYKEAPVLVSLRASQPPSIRLGAGHVVATGVDDPMIEVALNDLQLGIFMFIDGAHERVSGLNADLILNVRIERTPTGALELAVEDIKLTDTRQLYNELVPLSDLSELFELVVDVAVDTLLGDALHFELDISQTISDALGGVPLTMRVNTIRRDIGPTSTPYLSVYATLCSAADEQNPEHHSCYLPPPPPPGRAAAAHRVVLADRASLYQPKDPVRFPDARWVAMPSGEARLTVHSEPAVPEGYEYQWRVDRGPWSTFHAAPEGELLVTSARLNAIGEHHIEVRARRTRRSWSRSEPIEVLVWVDHERPLLTAARTSAADGAEQVQLVVEELGSPEQVTVHLRRYENGRGGAWTTVASPVDITGWTGDLEFVARDAAGNVSDPSWIYLGAAPSPSRDPVRTATAGCAATQGGAFIALTVAALLVRRRRG